LSGPFVLDASLTLSWAFDDEATPFTVHVLKTLETVYAVVPALWPFEVASVLTVAERRGRINAGQQAEFLERLRLLPITIEHRPAVWLGQQILRLTQAYRAYRLSAYDAAYLELAIRNSLPLATLDQDLRTAALSAGVPLLTEEV
jgi:predicted nucleic acid-binding protein